MYLKHMNREIAIMINNMKIFGRFIFTGNRIKIVQIMATAMDVMKIYFSVLGLWFRLVMLFIFWVMVSFRPVVRF